jgi:hypothetical protein
VTIEKRREQLEATYSVTGQKSLEVSNTKKYPLVTKRKSGELTVVLIPEVETLSQQFVPTGENMREQNYYSSVTLFNLLQIIKPLPAR